MTNKIIAGFIANGMSIQLIAHDDGRDGYTVFTRVLNNWELDDVDVYNVKDNAVARFLFLTNRILMGVQ